MHLCYFTRWQKSKIEVNLGFLYLFGSVEEYWYPNIAEIKVVGPSLSKKQSRWNLLFMIFQAKKFCFDV